MGEPIEAIIQKAQAVAKQVGTNMLFNRFGQKYMFTLVNPTYHRSQIVNTTF